MMDVQQRFLRRKRLIEQVDIFLREAVYHRTHDIVEDSDSVVIWRWDEEEGASEDPL